MTTQKCDKKKEERKGRKDVKRKKNPTLLILSGFLIMIDPDARLHFFSGRCFTLKRQRSQFTDKTRWLGNAIRRFVLRLFTAFRLMFASCTQSPHSVGKCAVRCMRLAHLRVPRAGKRCNEINLWCSWPMAESAFEVL